jgi:outer membrane protein
VKKFLLSAAAVAVLAGFSSFVVTAWGQGQKSQATTAQPQSGATPTHKIGLIDMAHIFKNYKKFNTLRDELKVEIEGSDKQAREMAETIKSTQEQMKRYNEGTPEFAEHEKKLAQLTSEFETFRKVQQREFLRKESGIYKTVYLEASDAVEKYAQYYGYTLIIRFNREGLDSADDPQTVIQRMNRQVVYHTPEDDITDKILGYLNREYSGAAGGAAAAPAARSAGNAAPGRQQ